MSIKALIRPAADLGSVEIVLRLTAIVLLLRPTGPWSIRPVIIALAILVLIVPKIMRVPATWYALTALMAARVIWDWPIPDNHLYLLVYWCLAVALALGSTNPPRILRASSSLLIGLVFALAVLWKAGLSPDYLDGRFFRVTLVTDPRFEHSAMLLGGLTEKQLEGNRQYLEPIEHSAELRDRPDLVEPPTFRRLVALLTWGGVIGEALVAISWLLSLSGWFTKMRHPLLLIFCSSTYAIAPVAGFGWLLLTMGLVSCSTEQRLLRGAYIVAWILVLLYAEVPWSRVLLE